MTFSSIYVQILQSLSQILYGILNIAASTSYNNNELYIDNNRILHVHIYYYSMQYTQLILNDSWLT